MWATRPRGHSKNVISLVEHINCTCAPVSFQAERTFPGRKKKEEKSDQTKHFPVSLLLVSAAALVKADAEGNIPSPVAEEKALKDDEILQNLPVGTTVTLYFRDLGPQIGWTMVSSKATVGYMLQKCILLLRTMRAYECILVVSLVFCLQVFFAECVGSLLSYLLFYFRAPYVYSQRYALASSHHPVVT